MMQMRIDDYGFKIGKYPKGKLNKITDVSGIKVGHYTVDTDRNKTGVTVIIPCEDNPFVTKLTAAAHIINGYGKSAGLMQINELGVIEGPIFLTNTLNVGRVHDAAVEHMVRRCASEKVEIKSYNPVVCECNDAYLNDIVHRAVGEDEVFAAIDTSVSDFIEGDIGAGKGMSCHQLKGGIGSASRVVKIENVVHLIGVLVLSNHGSLEDFIISGQPYGETIKAIQGTANEVEKGSIIIVVATDLPLSDRQLGRLIRRVPIGLAKTGSYMGHGSGEMAIGFTTRNRVPGKGNYIVNQIQDSDLDGPFHALAEAVEEAVLNSMVCSERTEGFGGNVRESLKKYLPMQKR
ncbi:MAG: P1 family peptidase [Clostridia bacterium]|nr:P1 family peptidase [Clostridia bacterium]